ncbi:MAG TPA: hypothetical protein PKY90_06455 [Bacillota bacterium]|nr:hypothetical protein [Bacillota bacterium]
MSYRGAAINTISITYGSVKCVAHVFYEAREAKEATEEARGTGVSASKLQKAHQKDRRINGAHSLAGMVVEMQNHKNIRIFKKSADIRKDLSA